MRIGIDVSRAAGRRTGIGQYVSGLVDALARVDGENRYLLYPRFWDSAPSARWGLDLPDRPGFALASDPCPPGRAWPFGGARDDCLGGVDVVHAPLTVPPPLRRTPLVATVHDLSHLLFPECHTASNRRLTGRHVRRAAAHADRIIVPSEATRRDLVARLGADPDRVRVIPHAVRRSIRPEPDPERLRRALVRFGIDRRFILYAGAIEPRKNLVRLLSAFEEVARRLPGRHLLVLAGPRGWRTGSFDAALSASPAAAAVRSTGYVTDAELSALYTACRLFVYPSRHEGFGFPPLEAMACGAPVVASDASSIPEVVGDAGILVDPLDAEALAEAMIRVLADDGLRADLRRRGFARAARFSWEETARRTAAVYREAAERG